MIPLDSDEWHDLRDAEGVASIRVPGILKRLYAHPSDKEALNDAWNSLCYKGEVYSASVAALPHLVMAATETAPLACLDIMFLVGSIVEGVDRSNEFEIDESFDGWKVGALTELMDTMLYQHLDTDELRSLLATIAALKGDPALSAAISNLDPLSIEP